MNYAQLVRDNVAKYGFHATYVGATEGDQTGSAFTYSTGIYETYGIPEIIISSLPCNLSHELITQYIHRFQANGPVIDQRITAKNERFDYYLVRVPLERIQEYVLATIKYYVRKPYQYLQLIYPDTELLFPGEVGYDYDQELFGVFPPVGIRDS
jgi:hypothetical protein